MTVSANVTRNHYSQSFVRTVRYVTLFFRKSPKVDPDFIFDGCNCGAITISVGASNPLSLDFVSVGHVVALRLRTVNIAAATRWHRV